MNDLPTIYFLAILAIFVFGYAIGYYQAKESK
jgi:hypothetical protein